MPRLTSPSPFTTRERVPEARSDRVVDEVLALGSDRRLHLCEFGIYAHNSDNQTTSIERPTVRSALSSTKLPA